MKGSIGLRLAEAVNDMGNVLTAAKWPTLSVHHPNGVKIYDAKETFKELTFVSMEAQNQLSDLKDCVNELCLKCGQYKERYLGACKDCRWLKVQEALR